MLYTNVDEIVAISSSLNLKYRMILIDENHDIDIFHQWM